MISYCFYLEKEVDTESCTVCGKEKLCNIIHEFVQNEFKYEKEIEELKKEITELNKAYEGYDF